MLDVYQKGFVESMWNRRFLLACLLVSVLTTSFGDTSSNLFSADSDESLSVVKTTAKNSRFAYCTLHYEGTPRDEEYLLGIRVLIKSIQLSGTHEDVCVIAPETVSTATKNQLRADGAIVVEVEGIKNPYKTSANRRSSFQDRFDQTLNKLHLWNLTQYERIIYFDADNVVLENMDDLFKCGEFCAVYMNSVNFHTGLLALKPDRVVFEDMLQKLNTEDSYDGADQGFLVSYYADFLYAPLFDQSKDMSDSKMTRLSVNWNLHHIYYLEKANWDFYKRGNFENLRVPAASIAYPIAPIWKPWYWWGYLWLPIHYEWYNFRLQIEEQFNILSWSPYITLMAAALSFEFVNGYAILTIYKRYHLYRIFHNTLTKWLMVILWFFLTLIITYKTIPRMSHPNTGLWFFIITQNFLFYSLFQKVNHTSKNTRAKMLLMSVIIQRILVTLMSAGVGIGAQLVLWVVALQGYFVSELAIVYYYCFKNSSASYFGMDNDFDKWRSGSVDFTPSETKVESSTFTPKTIV